MAVFDYNTFLSDLLEGEIFLQNLPSIITAHALGMFIISQTFCSFLCNGESLSLHYMHSRYSYGNSWILNLFRGSLLYAASLKYSYCRNLEVTLVLIASLNLKGNGKQLIWLIITL